MGYDRGETQRKHKKLITVVRQIQKIVIVGWVETRYDDGMFWVAAD